MVRRVARGVALLVLALLPPAVVARAAAVDSAPSSGPRPGGPVLLLGTAGLRWDDVDDSTPALVALENDDAVAALAVHAVRETTCPVDGWLTVSAGRPAADAPARGGCRQPQLRVATPGGPGQVTGWDTYRAQAAAAGFGADPGLLGATLAAAGRRVAAVGPGAAIATADRQGRTAHVWPGVPAGPQGTLDPGADAVGLSQQVSAAEASGADLVAVDLGSIVDIAAADAAPAGGSDTGPAARADQVTALDDRLGLILGALPPHATVIVASLADDGTGPHLQFLALSSPAGAGGPALTSGLARGAGPRDGLVASTDLLPTILRRLGVAPPATAAGSPLTGAPGGSGLDLLQQVSDLDAASVQVGKLATPFVGTAGLIEFLLLVMLGAAAQRGRRLPRTRHRTLTVLRVAAVGIALVPAATFLADVWPWWQGPLPGTQLGVAVVVATLPLGLLALAGPWRRHPLGTAGAVGAVTAGVLAGDLVTGSHLQVVAVLGGQPGSAERWRGLSTPSLGLLATGAVFLALGAAEALRRRGRPPGQQAWAVAAVGAVATVIAGAPALGDDPGGPPALMPAFALLALGVAGPLATRRLLLIAPATALVAGVLAAAAVDGARPVGLIGQNLDRIATDPLALLVLPAAAAVAAVLWDPQRRHAPALATAYRCVPLLRPGVGALGLALLIADLVSDTGTSAPPLALLIGAPLLVAAPVLVAVTAQAVDQDEIDRREAAAAAAARLGRRR